MRAREFATIVVDRHFGFLFHFRFEVGNDREKNELLRESRTSLEGFLNGFILVVMARSKLRVSSDAE